MFKSILIAITVFIFSVSVAAGVVFGQSVTPSVTSPKPSVSDTPIMSVTPTETIQGTESNLPSGAPNTGRGDN